MSRSPWDVIGPVLFALACNFVAVGAALIVVHGG